MKSSDQFGFYLFSKPQSKDTVLKDMLQYLRASSPGRSLQFSYVESETSLIPHLTLWENLHVVVGGSNWKEFSATLSVDWQPLVNLIRDPNIKASQSSCWERLTVSLIKATLITSQHIIIDINEDAHTPLNLMNFKKMLLNLAQQKNVYIASAQTDLWVESAHSLITRNGYEFVVEDLKQDAVKRHKTA